MENLSTLEAEFKNIRQELATIRKSISKLTFYVEEAQSEVPEKIRRFVTYMHNLHDIKNLFTEHGLEVPKYIDREVERCDDRLRQLLTELHTDGGAFEKIRREMAKDTENRWDHSRAISGPKKECCE